MIAKEPIITVLGPTATGKTGVAVRIAAELGGEIVSADSRQVFREMRIGTARPTDAQLAEVPHYFIADRSVTEPFTAGQFEVEALALLDRLFQDHETVVMAGGSGLYIDALCNGLDDFPPADPELREQLSARLRQEGVAALRAELRLLDPESYAALDPANGQRIVRALEVFSLTGETITAHDEASRNLPPRYASLFFIPGFHDRSLLYRRIDDRVEKMVEQGLFEEVRTLLISGVPAESTAMQAIGYKETAACLNGFLSPQEAVSQIKQASRRYAKRQLTWFARRADACRLYRDEPSAVPVPEAALSLAKEFLP
jgi:tRNA dimethylallyltransferase